MTRLRLAVVQHNFSKHWQEIQQYAHALVSELVKHHEVHVVTQHLGPDTTDRIEGVTYQTVSVWDGLPSWGRQWWFAYRARQITKKGFDVVHSFESIWGGDIQTVYDLPVSYALFAQTQHATKFKMMCALFRHPGQWLRGWIEKKSYRRVGQRHWVSLTRPLYQVLTQVMGCSSDQVSWIPAGVTVSNEMSKAEREHLRLQTRLQLAIPMGHQLMLWQGEDLVRGGLRTLLQTLAWLPEQYHVLLALTSAQQEVLEIELTPSIRARFHILNLEELSDPEILFWAADILVQPTREHTIGVTVLQAMMHGLPVVASSSKYGGLASEWTQGQQAIILNDPQDAQELRRAILIALDDQRIHELGVRARHWAKSHNWQNIVKLHEKLYFSLLNRADLKC